ncbi:MAG: flagellar motor switch protein FliG [Candidatus Schekmanbacteria bacterium]|nr:flagellar motor switch protein FliG [Candidatus Schekmanbacteria bacterium]
MAKEKEEASGPELPGLRKAAILMVLLGEEASGEVFKHLQEEEIQLLSREISMTAAIDPTIADTVLDDFNNLMKARDYYTTGGLDYARKVLQKSLGPEHARRIVDRLQRLIESSAGFSSLEKANPQQLSKFIQSEHPQTIALILAHLDASQAAKLLTSLPERLQSDVAMRMASLEEISPEVVRRISMILEQKLAALGNYDVAEFGGVRAVAEMLNRMDRTAGRIVLEKVEAENPELAAAVRDYMFVFDDILMIDDSGVRDILKRVDKRVLATALKGTAAEMQELFYRNMSKRAAELLQVEMDYMGPVRLKDVERAQHEVVEIVRQLEEDGLVTLGGGGGEEFVV